MTLGLFGIVEGFSGNSMKSKDFSECFYCILLKI